MKSTTGPIILALVWLTISSIIDHFRIMDLKRKVDTLTTHEYKIVCNQRKKLETIQNSIWGCMGIKAKASLKRKIDLLIGVNYYLIPYNRILIKQSINH